MAKKKKQFSPHIYPEWGELFDAVSIEERSELLLAITKFPEYEPYDIPIWNFIKSQLQKDYEIFVEKCEKNGEISKSYWEQKKSNDTERIPNVSERIPNDIERHPKRITNNELQITKTETKTETKTKTETDNIYGECVNVHLTHTQYSKLLNEILSEKALKELINELSLNIARGKAPPYDEKQPDCHYASLKVYWRNKKLKTQNPTSPIDKAKAFKDELDKLTEQYRLKEANSG